MCCCCCPHGNSHPGTFAPSSEEFWVRVLGVLDIAGGSLREGGLTPRFLAWGLGVGGVFSPTPPHPATTRKKEKGTVIKKVIGLCGRGALSLLSICLLL